MFNVYILFMELILNSNIYFLFTTPQKFMYVGKHKNKKDK